MLSKTLSFALLSCVTSAERASAIEGDLLEERAVHGRVWFALQVIRTTFALLGFAVTQAPFRTATLSACGVAVSILMCLLVSRVFFGTEALIPVPFFGFATIVACAVLIGAALACAAGALGVRAAAGTAVLLVLMFVAAQMLGGLDVPWSADSETTGLLGTLGWFAVNFAFACCMYPAPLLIASACAHTRRV